MFSTTFLLIVSYLIGHSVISAIECICISYYRMDIHKQLTHWQATDKRSRTRRSTWIFFRIYEYQNSYIFPCLSWYKFTNNMTCFSVTLLHLYIHNSFLWIYYSWHAVAAPGGGGAWGAPQLEALPPPPPPHLPPQSEWDFFFFFFLLFFLLMS